MINSLSKADQKKINKLEEAFDQLISGEKNYFSITKLISIKSLCKDEQVRQQYCCYLFNLVAERLLNDLQDKSPSTQLQSIASAIRTVAKFSMDELSLSASKDLLRVLYRQLADYQNETENVKSTTVRIVKNNDLLTLELSVACLLNTEEAAQTKAYHATRNYVEKYNGSIGTGLITDSIPALEDVLVFWRGLSGEYGDLGVL